MDAKDLLDAATKAAGQVRKEKPSLWTRFITWRREIQCAKGLHFLINYSFYKEYKIYNPGTLDTSNALPTHIYDAYKAQCKYCGAPMIYKVYK